MTKRTGTKADFSRRGFVRRSAGFATVAAMSAAGITGFPAILRAASHPVITHGLQAGDVTTSRGVIWARTDRPARMTVEVATSESFANARRLRGPAALDISDFCGKIDLSGLPSGQDIFYRVQFQDLADLIRVWAR